MRALSVVCNGLEDKRIVVDVLLYYSCVRTDHMKKSNLSFFFSIIRVASI